MSAASGASTHSARHAAALAYAESGLYVFPARVAIEIDSDGVPVKKIRTIVEWQRVATRDPSRIDAWFGPAGTWADASVAVATGPSRLSVVDPDGPDGMAEWQTIRDTYGIDDETPHYRTPGGGEHWWYRTDPERPLPTKAHTVDAHVDTRGGIDGRGSGFVIVPPSVDDRGAYEWITDAPDAVDELPAVPEAVHALIEDRATRKAPIGTEAHNGDRRFTLAQAQEFARPALDALAVAGRGEVNDALNTAARVVAHFGGEFWTREQAEKRLMQLQLRDWHDGDERSARATIESAHKAQAEAYASGAVDADGRPTGWYATYVEPNPLGDDDEPDADGDKFETDVGSEQYRQRVREEAARRLRAERTAHRPRIADGVTFNLDDITPPVMLLGSLIPDLAVGFIAGRSGAYKSFLAVAWACCIATGTAWLGRDEFAVTRPLRTLYVAAEGRSGAAGRIRAWEEHTGVSRDGRLAIYGRPIHLTDESQVDELAAYVAEHGFEFVVIDTYHRSAPGAEENSSTEFGVVFEAAARLRDDHGAGVLFVDHTGHAGERLRGTSAKGDDADYVLTSSYVGVTRGPEVPRTLAVQKLKDDESGAEWPLALAPVDGSSFPVVVIGDGQSSATGFDRSPDWHLLPTAELPEKVTALGVRAAEDVYRVMLSINEQEGLTLSQVEAAINEECPRKHSRTSITRGWAAMLAARITEYDGRAQSRRRLAPEAVWR